MALVKRRMALGRRYELMYKYVKSLPYPLDIKKKDLKMAKNIITQFGGANGELGAALRYFSQKFSMPDDMGRSLLNDIATEELLQFRCQSKTRKITFREKLSFKYLPPLSFL